MKFIIKLTTILYMFLNLCLLVYLILNKVLTGYYVPMSHFKEQMIRQLNV